MRDLIRTPTSVLALGTVGRRAVVERLDPRSLRVLAKAVLPEAGLEALLAAGGGRVLLALSGSHPRLLVLRERDLVRVATVTLPGQPSLGSNVAGIGDVAVVGLQAGGVLSVDLRASRVARAARLTGTNTQVAAAGGAVVAVGAGADHIGLSPFVLEPATLRVRRRVVTSLGYVQRMVGRDDTVWITSTGGPTSLAGTPVPVRDPHRVEKAVREQGPSDATYVPGGRTVWAASNGLDCFDRRSGRFLAYSPGPASGLAVVDPNRVLTAAGTSVEIWRPVGRCATT